MIKVENLSKSFGPKMAVNRVSFTVERGEVLGFFGAKRGREIDHHAHDHRLYSGRRGGSASGATTSWKTRLRPSA